MVIGVAVLTLDLPEATTLKDKRSVIQSVTRRLRSRYNVAVAEVDTQDALGTITLGIACLSTTAGHAHAMLEKAVRHVEEARLDAVLTDYQIELL